VPNLKPPMVCSRESADRLTDQLDRVLAEPRLTLLRAAL